MSTLTKTAFEAIYTDNTTGTFADNTTQAISAGDMRQFADDIADSFTVSGGLNWKIVQIGDWDMDTTASVNVAHGIPFGNYQDIRVVDVQIIRDIGAVREFGPLVRFEAGVGIAGGVVSIDSTNITIGRLTGGYFDNSDFNATSFNRGYIAIGYVD